MCMCRSASVPRCPFPCLIAPQMRIPLTRAILCRSVVANKKGIGTFVFSFLFYLPLRSRLCCHSVSFRLTLYTCCGSSRSLFPSIITLWRPRFRCLHSPSHKHTHTHTHLPRLQLAAISLSMSRSFSEATEKRFMRDKSEKCRTLSSPPPAIASVYLDALDKADHGSETRRRQQRLVPLVYLLGTGSDMQICRRLCGG